MIALIEGIVVSRAADAVVVMTGGGVGYRLFVSLQTLAMIAPEGEPVRLFVHTHVREDALQLYGFSEESERDAFLMLTSVSGVGARVAMGILSTLDVPALVRAVQASDLRALTAAPGVGKKTAGRLALELKDRVEKLGVVAAPHPPPAATNHLDDLRSALTNLGFRPNDVERSVLAVEKDLPKDGPLPPLEDLLRRALQTTRQVR